MTDKTYGYFNDDGTEFNPDLAPAPALCAACRRNENPEEEVACNLTRNDQSGGERFLCFAYQSIRGLHETQEVLNEMQQYLDQKYGGHP